MNAAVVGGVIGGIFQLVLVAGVFAFCVYLCHWCHKRRRRRTQAQLNVVNTATVVHVPQPLPPAAYQPPYPGYQPVYFQPGYIPMPMPPGAPPSYLEATDPVHAPLTPAPGPQMYPFSNYPQPMQPHVDESAQKPYNPAYCPNV